MTPRERVLTAMGLGVPDRVPVMCQMATGHILLQSGVDPVAEATESDAFAESLWRMREQYDFDGILIHKPGRQPAWLIDGTERRRCSQGWEFHDPDGSFVRVQTDDDPVFFPPPDFTWPTVDEIDPDDPLGFFEGGLLRWHLWKGTHSYHEVERIPEYWYGCIDRLKQKSGGRYSLHGETRAPFDHVLSLVSAPNLMMALIDHPDQVHRLMAWATRSSIAWSIAQIRRGCDAIKISSPWVGRKFISPRHYDEFVVPYERQLIEAIRGASGFVLSLIHI